MSTKAYKLKSRQWMQGEAQPCLGLCGNDYDSAYASVTNAHPEWTQARREARAWIEMFKRGGTR